MPGYTDYYTGAFPEGKPFRMERRSTTCCPHCNGTEFDRIERDPFKPDQFGLAEVRCRDCGQWSKVHMLQCNYENEYHIEEA